MIIVCGEALIDMFIAGAGSGRRSERAARAIAGGSPFNLAVGVARLGMQVGFLGAIGTDGLGDFLLGLLQAEGVDTALVKRSTRPTPLVAVSPGADGHPGYVFYATDCAYADVTLGDLPAQLPVAVEALAFGSFSMTVDPVGQTLLALAEREKDRRFISLDPNVRPALMGDPAAWRDRFARFARTASLIKLSIEDLLAAWGDDAPMDVLAANWLANGVELVVVTDGPNGATAYHRDGKIQVTGRPVDVVDTVGAGDSFHAALLAELAEGGNLRRGAVTTMGKSKLCEVLEQAVRAASITCSRAGADLPTQADLIGAE
ncbi:carbohydrate kinase [Acidisphaera sp. L21]|uniref:carbohydrate kinase family protein n=1 Tax=Acidisphaera sp. L21 TaxID=1641851 RepID=UPI00131AB66A|nr:carbohydrate kinase [Acidisphaera sp. L21]